MLQAMKDHPISQRRACVLIGVDPKTVRRERPPDNPDIRLEMNKIAEKRRRFGYRRIGIMLERKGMVMNEKKLYRIYREEGLSVRRRRGRKRARGSRTPMPVPLLPNQRWSLDFLSDTFGACRKFRILAVNDDCCRENLRLCRILCPGAFRYAIGKRSSNMIANWLLTACHSRTERFHS